MGEWVDLGSTAEIDPLSQVLKKECCEITVFPRYCTSLPDFILPVLVLILGSLLLDCCSGPHSISEAGFSDHFSRGRAEAQRSLFSYLAFVFGLSQRGCILGLSPSFAPVSV